MNEKIEIRSEIMAFAEAMECVMRKHDPTKGDSWKTCKIRYLLAKDEEETEEFNLSGKKKELLDRANIIMMLWHRLED